MAPKQLRKSDPVGRCVWLVSAALLLLTFAVDSVLAGGGARLRRGGGPGSGDALIGGKFDPDRTPKP
jgi:hypothetical protein